MSLEVEAVYENGVLKPVQPLPLAEHERVTVQVFPRPGRMRQRAGAMRWTGDVETLRRIAEDPEFRAPEAT